MLEGEMRNIFVRFVAFCLVFIGFAPLSAQQKKPEQLSRGDFDRVLANPGDEAAFQDFLRKSPQYSLRDGEVTRTYYVAEGDLLLDEQQMRAYIYSHAFGSQAANRVVGELRVMTVGGQPAFWKKGERSLTYVVARKTFASRDQYDLVAKNMSAAARDWQNICQECGLSFQYRADLDDSPSLDAVTFIVEYDPGAADFIAAAFFPSDPIFKRHLVIGPQYFTTSFDKVGVLRHETGHILGYRHEHILGIPGCFTEDNNWKPLTDYDPHSVMHYFCGGGGSMDFKFTETDRAGHHKLYE
jgi:hypothetical protein